MKIVSWNVNGIRSVYNKGFVEWFDKESPDILCIQESKADLEQFPTELIKFKNYQLVVNSAQKKGYSGVATWSRKKILDTKKLDDKKFDNEGRTLIHEFEDFFLFNCYFPNGQRDHARVDYKLEFSNKILQKENKLKKEKPVIILGDYNTAHQEIDLSNPRANQKTTGFLPNEREWMTHFFENGFLDGFRIKNPDKKDEYTWWTYRNDCRVRNIGWRIDYINITEDLKNQVKSVDHLQSVLGSDHCPVRLILKK